MLPFFLFFDAEIEFFLLLNFEKLQRRNFGDFLFAIDCAFLINAYWLVFDESVQNMIFFLSNPAVGSIYLNWMALSLVSETGW